jgi:hypothetical protein
MPLEARSWSRGAGEIADGLDGNPVDVAFGLDDVLPADDRLGVVGDTVDPAVAGGPGLVGVKAHRLEQVPDHGLERLGREVDQVGPLIQAAEDLFFVDEAGVIHVELKDRRDGLQLGGG